LSGPFFNYIAWTIFHLAKTLGTGEAVIGLPGREPFWFKFTPVL
jgi:hypothetical protein